MAFSVYISAPYSLRSIARDALEEFAVAGIECTARWISDESSATISPEWAQHDLDDVRAADALVALNPAEWTNSGTGGRHVELGVALTLGKPVYLVGARSNIFHHHQSVTACGSVAAVIRLIGASASEVA
jgi:nucleoside 2-deoxyribosyltransferase